MNQSPLDRVEHACAEIARAGQPVTFTAIAARAGLARATLHRNPQIRVVIDERRARQAEARTLSGLTAGISHLRAALEAVADVRQHEKRLRRFERRAAADGPDRQPANKMILKISRSSPR